MVLFIFYGSIDRGLGLNINEIKIEEISSILVIWGVLLESRAVFTKHTDKVFCSDDKLNELCEILGLNLLCLGLLLEFVGYFGIDMEQSKYPTYVLEIYHGAEWFIGLVVIVEMFYACYRIFTRHQ